MKKYFVVLVCVLSSYIVFSQSPQAFKYQAVTRGIDGNVLVNQHIQMRLSILAGDPNGGVVYSETHNVTTNEFGLVTLNIGGGTVETGEFSAINWGNNTYYLKIEADETGGNNFQWLGTSQLLSVPYALYAAKAG
ncbi:MAG: collagen-like protein, partial [Bacteroidetes bacterium]|nr:collagen-like protein [Bacteroidota bacterium]